MRFCSAALLTALAIVSICTEHMKVSIERNVVDSTPSVDGTDGGGGGLCSSGLGGGNGGGSWFT